MKLLKPASKPPRAGKHTKAQQAAKPVSRTPTPPPEPIVGVMGSLPEEPQRPVNSWRDPGEVLRQAIDHYRDYEPGSWFKKVRWLRAVPGAAESEPRHVESPFKEAARLAA